MSRWMSPAWTVCTTGFVAKLQTPGGVIYFFHVHRGKPIVSPALFEPIGEKFRKDINDWARASGVPVVRFRAGERKADVMAPYLDAAAASGRSQVAAVGCAQEFQLVWTARKRDTDPGKPPSSPLPRSSAGSRCSTCTSGTFRWGRMPTARLCRIRGKGAGQVAIFA